LTARGGMIYYQRRVGKRRIRFSTETNDWEQASAVARLYEEKKGIGHPGFVIVESPKLREFAKRHIEEDTGLLAATTLVGRRQPLSEGGPIMPFLGDRRIDEITGPVLREWWGA